VKPLVDREKSLFFYSLFRGMAKASARVIFKPLNSISARLRMSIVNLLRIYANNLPPKGKKGKNLQKTKNKDTL